MRQGEKGGEGGGKGWGGKGNGQGAKGFLFDVESAFAFWVVAATPE